MSDPTVPGWMPQGWADEMALIRITAAAYCVSPHFIGAIRKVENGAHGYNAFGVISPPMEERDTYAKQLEWACASVRNRLVAFDFNNMALMLYTTKTGRQVVAYTDEFIAWFGARWAPGTADNDPTHLNANWVSDVTIWYHKLIDEDHA